MPIHREKTSSFFLVNFQKKKRKRENFFLTDFLLGMCGRRLAVNIYEEGKKTAATEPHLGKWVEKESSKENV